MHSCFAGEQSRSGKSFSRAESFGFGARFGIQAKRYRSNVGNSAVQEANAGADYHDCQISAVVTQSGFTRAAREQASRLDRPCLLIGRAEIGDLARHLRAAMPRAG